MPPRLRRAPRSGLARLLGARLARLLSASAAARLTLTLTHPGSHLLVGTIGNERDLAMNDTLIARREPGCQTRNTVRQISYSL